MAATDAELVQRALAGSQRAYLELVRRYERPVVGLIVRMMRDRVAAEDLAQETFVKAFARLSGYDLRRKFSSWLLAIAHHTAIDYLRRPGAPTVSLDGDPRGDIGRGAIDRRIESPAEAAERAELTRALEDAIGRLRPEYRALVVLRCQEGLSYDELADVTGLPAGTVKSYLHRARKELAEHLKAAGWGELA